MNQQPEGRPVVIRPAAPASPPPRTLPRDATAMPVGIAANSVGLGGQQRWAVGRMLMISIPILIGIALAVAAWSAMVNARPLREFSLSNSVYAYDFLFYKSAETVNLLGGSGLKADNAAFAIAKPTNDSVADNCSELGKAWKYAFTAPVIGVERPVCQLGDTVFLVTFDHGKARHLFQITFTAPSAVSMPDVRQILQSLRVSLE